MFRLCIAIGALFIACSSSEHEPSPSVGTGGAPSGGASTGGVEQAGGAVHTGGSGGSGGHAGSGGRPQQYPCGTMTDRPTTTKTVEEYCASLPNGCAAKTTPETCGGFVLQRIERGCGFVHYVYAGDVQDHWDAVYDEETGKLVYSWHNGNYSSYCTDPLAVGTMPECASWSVKSCQGDIGGTGGVTGVDAGDGGDPDGG